MGNGEKPELEEQLCQECGFNPYVIMNEQDYNRLRETSWRRALTPAEHAEMQRYLAAHPEARESWEQDGELNLLLVNLPEAPAVSSNFTAQVLRAVEREEAKHTRELCRQGLSLWDRMRGWFPKAATALVLISSILLVHHQHQAANRAALARDVASLTQVVSAHGSAMMEDFESIRHLEDSPAKADTELLVLFK